MAIADRDNLESISFAPTILNIAPQESLKLSSMSAIPLQRCATLYITGITLLLGACQSAPVASSRRVATGDHVPTVNAPSLGFFSRIKAPGEHEPVLQLAARGAQVFRCEKQNGGATWVFRQPDAELFDNEGKPAGRHGANFSFEHRDGSRLVTTIAAHDEPPRSSDLRWLLLTAKSYGKGAFDGITHVQRINTAGGMPPSRCDAAQTGRVLRVDFTSDFVFYRPRLAQ